jgi:hypothetical protein
VVAQLPEAQGGLNSPSIFIDSANVIKTDLLRDYAYEFNLESKMVMDNITVSRAFNTSQIYDLVINQFDSYIERVDIKLLTGFSRRFSTRGRDFPLVKAGDLSNEHETIYYSSNYRYFTN